MADQQLPGISPLPKDLHVSDQKQFLAEIPALVEKLRLRFCHYAWDLNRSELSLDFLDECVGKVVDEIIEHGWDVAEVIERDLLREVTAYLGEVIVRTQNGWWQETDSSGALGSYVVFHVPGVYNESEPYYSGLDVYDHVLTLVIEAESITKWYEQRFRDVD